ncbi:oxidoreductase [Bacillus canaveralius]|uniref:Oxidoreductase n=1 Tax=Bacillus canaveralius TaxID=1403243 RepID=A0A2N5GS00_9BACI|nr:SDR family oxidoreductase [Bacillus canaveralius]PLR86335.1 oxidoreductase [Bacillus canaveralius]PLR98568.1 oxidoreductase [Bacillus canaveralius]
MNINLAGKKAIISGSTTGIGYAIAKGLAEAGATVLINGRSAKGVEEAVARLHDEVVKAEVTGFAADLSKSAEASRLMEYWPEADILVNNIGIFEPRPFFEIDDEEWEQYFQVNVMTAVRLTRYYAAGMVERGWGRVLFNGSSTGGFFSGEMVHYGATKAAILGLSRGVAESTAGSGVTANTFLPGPTRTEKVEEHFKSAAAELGQTFEEIEKDLFEKSLPSSLVKRFVSGKEVANLVVFLASEQAAAITGTAMRVDGGIVRSIL